MFVPRHHQGKTWEGVLPVPTPACEAKSLKNGTPTFPLSYEDIQSIKQTIYTKKKKYPDDFHFMKQNNHFGEGKKASKYDAKSTIFSWIA